MSDLPTLQDLCKWKHWNVSERKLFRFYLLINLQVSKDSSLLYGVYVLTLIITVHCLNNDSAGPILWDDRILWAELRIS